MEGEIYIAEGSGEDRSRPDRDFRVLCIMLAGLLLFAAAAKGFELAPGGLEGLRQPWAALSLLAVVAEVFWGVWLLLGVYPILTHRVSILLFVVFALFSGYQVVIGSRTCGCFGEFSISPWIALGLDGVVLIALVVFRPVKSKFV